MDRVAQVAHILNHPENWDFSGAREFRAGVDLGTFKSIVIVVDEDGWPRAATMHRAEVVRSGLIVDYVGALSLVREMMAEIRQMAPRPIEIGATSYPPWTEAGNINTTRYILEAAGLEVVAVLDEPTAANLVLRMDSGALVDVGGGTTGVAVIQDGRVVTTSDEPTGGVHLSLVLAGGYKISLEEAEEIKQDPARGREVLTMVRPVIDKISTLVARDLAHAGHVERVCLVGGTCELEGLCEVVEKNLGLPTFRPPAPRFITPLGIALSAWGGNGHGAKRS